MTRKVRQIAFAIITGASVALGIAFIASPDLVHDRRPPDDLRGKIAWLAEHPADWLTASNISDRSLDSEHGARKSIWRTSRTLAAHLAPRRLNTSAGFVRAGLFHWYELDSHDRNAILHAAAVLMREQSTFNSLYVPLFDLTRNFDYLRRNAPRNRATLSDLNTLAATNGLFVEYRKTREALRDERWKEFLAKRGEGNPSEIINLLPAPISTRDEPLARGILEELDRESFSPQEVGPRIEDLALFAIRHRLQPLTGLESLIEIPGVLTDVTRARLALALGNLAEASRIENTMTGSGSVEWIPYYLDRARLAATAGDTNVAEGYLGRAALLEMSDAVLATAFDVATALGQSENVDRYRRDLALRARDARAWTETCAQNEICSKAVAWDYVADGTVRIAASVVQTDQVPPYLEIYVDDALVAEGPIRDEHVFAVPTTPTLHRLEVRLVNGYTRNRIQRRVRLS